MKLILATNNRHKLKEVSLVLTKNIELLSLADINFSGEIPEDQDTLEGNASQKSHYIFDKFGRDCFADDTGLEIEALDGKPGVYSARYAGEGCSFVDNMEKVLQEMVGLENRSARFRTVISLIIDGKEMQFEGTVEGEMLAQMAGDEGFGYDAIFRPKGYDQSFAEMPLSEKNTISHRARAVAKLSEYLNQHF
ncbi:MAG: RdgB/HAM1 family non-canonical purine NTP pyrophosphatase [Flavobacteriales bacterium]|nr:RdgB/HAM1 family non-canonical purine NTP pyrophosphatase [Flavobacteriales bacterium]